MKRKLSDKRLLLTKLIEIEIQLGYDISDLVGYPLSSFNWDGVADTLEKRYDEYKKNNGVEYGS